MTAILSLGEYKYRHLALLVGRLDARLATLLFKKITV
jgi:hypothetical protein